MEPDPPKQWPCVQIDTMITVVTPWMRSLLFQLTMADPVKVMLVTQLWVGGHQPTTGGGSSAKYG